MDDGEDYIVQNRHVPLGPRTREQPHLYQIRAIPVHARSEEEFPGKQQPQDALEPVLCGLTLPLMHLLFSQVITNMLMTSLRHRPGAQRARMGFAFQPARRIRCNPTPFVCLRRKRPTFRFSGPPRNRTVRCPRTVRCHVPPLLHRTAWPVRKGQQGRSLNSRTVGRSMPPLHFAEGAP